MPTKNPEKLALQRKKYRESPKGKAAIKASQQRYFRSEKGKLFLTKREKQRYHRRARSLARRFSRASKDATKRNLEFLLSFEQWSTEIAKPCHYCSNQLGSPSETGIGLDRLDNQKGYVTANVVSCCKVCNQLKSNLFSEQETKAMVSAVLALRSTEDQLLPL